MARRYSGPCAGKYSEPFQPSVFHVGACPHIHMVSPLVLPKARSRLRLLRGVTTPRNHHLFVVLVPLPSFVTSLVTVSRATLAINGIAALPTSLVTSVGAISGGGGFSEIGYPA